jgi:GMP synthase (glutamine-hydrolysing)
VSALRLLVADGNTAADRQRVAATAGETYAESYAKVLRAIAPDADVELCTPADADPQLLRDLDAYDGVAVTGSALNVYKREPESVRQVDLVRELFHRGVPVFGSCWGLQVAAVAAGGEVAANTRGREVGFARKITLTEAGRAHPMHAQRPAVFDAPAVHGDEVVRLPANTVVTAWNEVSAVQAAEICFGQGVFWGVQYHPEYRLHDVACTLLRYGDRLVDEGFFRTLADLQSYAADLESLEADPTRRDIAWRYGLGRELLAQDERVHEIANWVAQVVRPRASGRGRQ